MFSTIRSLESKKIEPRTINHKISFLIVVRRVKLSVSIRRQKSINTYSILILLKLLLINKRQSFFAHYDDCVETYWIFQCLFCYVHSHRLWTYYLYKNHNWVIYFNGSVFIVKKSYFYYYLLVAYTVSIFVRINSTREWRMIIGWPSVWCKSISDEYRIWWVVTKDFLWDMIGIGCLKIHLVNLHSLDYFTQSWSHIFSVHTIHQKLETCRRQRLLKFYHF